LLSSPMVAISLPDGDTARPHNSPSWCDCKQHTTRQNSIYNNVIELGKLKTKPEPQQCPQHCCSTQIHERGEFQPTMCRRPCHRSDQRKWRERDPESRNLNIRSRRKQEEK
jgi:hypothetical protein